MALWVKQVLVEGYHSLFRPEFAMCLSGLYVCLCLCLCLCVLVFYASQCEVLVGSVFAPCHGYISPNVYQQQCRYQACRCGSSCLCTALAHYAYLCSKHGVNIDFRSQVSECGECFASGSLFYPQCSNTPVYDSNDVRLNMFNWSWEK